MYVLSIQSHVSYGYVGNRCAQFVLELLGHEIYPINTVNLSCHVGYEGSKGQFSTKEEVLELVDSILSIPGIKIDAVLSGFVGDANIVDAICIIVKKLKRIFPNILYFCDPVMGDNDQVYVNPLIPDKMKESLIPLANYLLPNHFEFNLIVDENIHSHKELIRASKKLFTNNLKGIVITSFYSETTDASEIECVLITPQELHSVISHKIGRSFTGSGDTMSALFASHILNNKDDSEALSLSASSLYSILAETSKTDRQELCLIQGRTSILAPDMSQLKQR